MKIGLFIPCYVDALYPEVGKATYKLLCHLGLDVTYPERQTCCGQPMSNAGFEPMAKHLAGHFEEMFASSQGGASSAFGAAFSVFFTLSRTEARTTSPRAAASSSRWMRLSSAVRSPERLSSHSRSRHSSASVRRLELAYKSTFGKDNIRFYFF